MLEIAFYHHTRRSVDDTLPTLLERSLARGWRAVVQVTTAARLRRLDAHLWSYRAESFLPHGGAGDDAPQSQPVYLTLSDDNPNDADVRFLIEGAQAAPVLGGDAAPRERLILMFDEGEKEDARAQWTALRDAGHNLVYYQQGEAGGWEVKAREPKAL